MGESKCTCKDLPRGGDGRIPEHWKGCPQTEVLKAAGKAFIAWDGRKHAKGSARR